MKLRSRSCLRHASLVAGVIVLLAGCGSSSSGSGSGSSGSNGTTTIKFGYVPYGDDGPLFLGIDKGFFKSRGLDVKPIPEAAPTPIVANLLSGQQQFGFVTTNVLINAVAHNLPIKCVSTVDGNQSPSPKNDSAVMLAAPGSGVSSVSQLQNKTVAVVQLNSLNSVDVQESVAEAGGDPSSVHLTALPFPQMPQALKSGRVAAAMVVSPFSATALKEGSRPIAYPNSSLFPNGTITCIAASASYIKSHPQQVKAWQAAINQSAQYAKTHLPAARATLTRYLSLSPTAAAHAVLSTNWDTNVNTASVQKQEALLKKFGALSTIVPVGKLFYSP
ncbi:MAG TPA: ABC transporter substrate-binding protein [Solirubrobacteraceae bacterium]|nr:ABC transporter substrate-binding protein [Solirubrobacteraceae bacterium]